MFGKSLFCFIELQTWISFKAKL